MNRMTQAASRRRRAQTRPRPRLIVACRRRAQDRRLPSASFYPICPFCAGEDLVVVSATLVATGEEVSVGEPLDAHGFEIYAAFDLPDCSTEEETVMCTTCDQTFSLADVTR